MNTWTNECSEIVWGIWCLRIVWSYFVFPLCRKEQPYALNCIIARQFTGSNHNMWEPQRSSHTTCSSPLQKNNQIRIEGEWFQLKVIQLIKTKSILYLPLFSLLAKPAAFPFHFYSLFEKKHYGFSKFMKIPFKHSKTHLKSGRHCEFAK